MNGYQVNNGAQAGNLYVGGGGVQHTPSQVPAPSPVMIAQKQLDAATNDLHGIIGDLGMRLSSVLAPEETNRAIGNDVPSPPTVAGQISMSARIVEGACQRLRDILSRLEV